MTNKDRIWFLEASLTRQLGWIAAADSKASLAFAIDTAMLGLLAAVAPKTASAWTVAPAILASFAVLFGLATLLFLSIASFPRTQGPKGSVIYFGGIAQRDVAQFETAVETLSEEGYIADLSGQVHRNAEIATRKFAWVQRALMSLYISVVPWGVALLLVYNS